MTRDEARTLLELLAELLPAHAPGISDEFVSAWWSAHLVHLDFVFAARVVARLADGWDKPHFPRPGEFSAVRNAMEIRGAIDAARAAVRGAHAHPSKF